jgi:hypothetical protein
VVVEVDEDDGPIGVLGLCRAHEAPNGGVAEVEDVLGWPHRDGAAREHDQPAGFQTLVNDPGLQERERTVGSVVDRLGRRVTRLGRPGDHHDFRPRLAPAK